MNSVRSFLSVLAYVSLSLLALSLPAICPAQEPGQTEGSGPKYKLTVLEGASTSKRVKKGRVSSQTVVKITDENNVPVPGVAVSFTLPQLTSGAPAFVNGALTSVVTTNAAGVASSGSITAVAGSTFSVTVTASLTGGSVLTAAVPITTSALAATGAAGAAGAAAAGGAGAGISTGVIIGVVVAVGAAAAAGVAVSMSKGGSDSSSPTTSTPSGVIGGAGTPTFGPPH